MQVQRTEPGYGLLFFHRQEIATGRAGRGEDGVVPPIPPSQVNGGRTRNLLNNTAVAAIVFRLPLSPLC